MENEGGADASTVELLLVSGEVRRIVMPSHSGSFEGALDRLQTWIRTLDGTWVQRRYVVEVRPLPAEQGRNESKSTGRAVGE